MILKDIFYKETDSLNEIVFEHREKNYGAYILRKHYKRNKIIGLATSVLLFALCFGGTILHDYLARYSELEDLQMIATYEPIDMQRIDDLIPPPPSQVPPISLPKINPPVEEDNSVPIVTDTVTKPLVTDNNNLMNKDSLNKTVDSLAKKTANGSVNGSDSTSNAIYFVVEKMPEFPGGFDAINRYIRDNVQYPPQAIKKNIFGIVYVTFCITNTGEIDKAYIAKSVNPILDAEAIRVVKLMPKWIPGVQNGKNVKVWYTLPINFMPMKSANR